MSIREHLSIVASDFVAILRTRVELIGAELAEQKHRLFSFAILLLAAAVFLLLAVVLGSFLFVAFFWNTDYRLWAIAALATVYALIGIGLIWRVCYRLKTEPSPFAASIEEFHRDLAVLGSLRAQSAAVVAPTDRKTGGHHE
jgi:uncharacterized membrane protein YqjE